jgi:hypothetical protein
MAAEILMIIRRRKNPVLVFSDKYTRTHHLWRGGDSIHVLDQPLP